MNQTFSEALNQSVLVFDGAGGTEIYRRHVFTNQCYDELNLRNRKLISDITLAYFNAGVDVLTTNTYGANRFALERYGAEASAAAINRAGVEIAREIASQAGADRQVFVAGSVGFPSVEVLTRRERREIVQTFASQIAALIESNVDFILFESQPTRETAEIMVDAIGELQTAFPFVVSYALQTSRFQEPNSLETRAKYFKALFASFENAKTQPIAWGLNCGLDPLTMLSAVKETVKTLDRPLIVQPTAGAPQSFEGRQLYYASPEYLATYAMRYVDLGVAAVGGCCGTTPEEIAEVVKMVKPTSRGRKTEIVLGDARPNVVEREDSPVASRSKLSAKLTNGEWVQTVEAVPPCGSDLTKFVEKARTLHERGVDAVNLPDGPRASARISSIVAADRIYREVGIEPILHVCARDRNLIALQADLIGCSAMNLNNILFITGDPPKLGPYPNATGVFDCDSIGMCKIQRRLNRGVDLGGQALETQTNAFIGCGFDPSAIDRAREIERLRQKIEAGAQFAVTQPVFDPNVLISFIEECGGVTVPIIAGVWPFVSYRNALFMRKEVPGVIVPDEIMARMEEAATRSKEDQIATGVQIARESLETLRAFVQGVQVSAPLGRIDVSLMTLGKI